MSNADFQILRFSRQKYNYPYQALETKYIFELTEGILTITVTPFDCYMQVKSCTSEYLAQFHNSTNLSFEFDYETQRAQVYSDKQYCFSLYYPLGPVILNLLGNIAFREDPLDVMCHCIESVAINNNLIVNPKDPIKEQYKAICMSLKFSSRLTDEAILKHLCNLDPMKFLDVAAYYKCSKNPLLYLWEFIEEKLMEDKHVNY